MPINDNQTVSQDLSLFGGQVKDIAPGNLPAGVSPQCQDMFFSGQYTATRPALYHVLASALGTGDILSHNDYPQQNGTTETVIQYADGSLWTRNVQTGSATQVGTSSPGVRFNSVSAFNHFFMAYRSLGLVSSFTNATLAGGDVPRYINPLGHVWRVTSDAPGGGFSVSPITIAPEDVVLPGVFVMGPAVTSVTLTGEETVVITIPNKGTETFHYWTAAEITLASSVTLVPNQIVQLYGINWAGPQWLNGVAVASVIDGTHFTIAIAQTSLNISATSGTFGYVPDAGSAQSLTRSNNIVTAYLTDTSPSTPTQIQPGWYVSLVDTQASSNSAVPISGAVPFTDNELFQAIFPQTSPGTIPTWIEGATANFYTYSHTEGGVFNFNYPGTGSNIPLPAPIATYQFSANQSVLFNSNGTDAGNLLKNAPQNGFNYNPWTIFGVTTQNLIPIRRVYWGVSAIGTGNPSSPGNILTILVENDSGSLPASVVPGATIILSGFINPFHDSLYPATGGSDAGSQFVDVNLDGTYTVIAVGTSIVGGSEHVQAFTVQAPSVAHTYSHDYGSGLNSTWPLSGWFFQVENETTTTPVWDGTAVMPYSGATTNVAMIISGYVYLPAGQSTFFLDNADGMQMGFASDVTFVSRTGNVGNGLYQPGGASYGQPQTVTALNGYPIAWAGNQGTNYAGVQIFEGTVTVSVAQAGIYGVELDYVNWAGDATLNMLNVIDSVNTPMLPSGGPGQYTAKVQGDGVGNVHVTLPTPVEALPIGAWLYLYLNPPSSADVNDWTITSNGTGSVVVHSTDFSVNEEILLGGFSSVKTPQPTTWNGQTVTITSAINNGNGSQTLQFNWTGTPGTGTTTTGTVTPVSAQYPSGWVQVTQVLSTSEFVYYAINNTETLLASGTVYDYFGSLNTQQSLTAALPGQSTASTSSQASASLQSSASGIVQGFQVLSVNSSTTPNFITWYQSGFNDTYTGTHQLQVQPQSQIAAGPRNMLVFFLNEDGGTTPGSYPILLNLNGGTQFAQVTLPLGPAGTTARGTAWTPAYGADYFVLPAGNLPASGGNGPVIVTGTIVYDNTTTSTIIDFSDAALVDGIFVGPGEEAVGEDYGDLTSMIVLPPVIGVVEYNEQLAWWGELNCYPNHSMVNMGMAGGYNGSQTLGANAQPLGWDNATPYNSISPDAAGVLFTSSDNIGFEYGFPASGTSSLQFVMYSPSAGVIATASVAISGITSTRTWYSATFNAALPNPVPADAVLYMRAAGGANNGMISQSIYQDFYGDPIVLPNRTYVIRFEAYINGGFIKTKEFELIDQEQPVLNNQIRLSYIENPFAYDNENGFTVGLDTPDFVSAMFLQREQLYALTEGQGELHSIRATAVLPSDWSTALFARECGCSGPDAVTIGQSVAWWMGRHGVHVFEGGQPKKISQYNNTDFEKTNWNAAVNSCMAYDAVQRVLYMAFPTGATLNPSMTYSLNTRLADAAYNVPDPVHVSPYTGKIISTDLAQKWSPMSINFNSMTMSLQSTAVGVDQTAFAKVMTFGAQGFGQLYAQDYFNYPPTNPTATSWNAIDDDFSTIPWVYVTYPFFSHDTEIQTQIGVYRKLFGFMGMHVSGVGFLNMVPLIDSLDNPWPALAPWTLQFADPASDYNIGLNVTGNRMFLKFTGTPIPGSQGGDGFSTALWLTHLFVSARKDFVFPVGNGGFGGG